MERLYDMLHSKWHIVALLSRLRRKGEVMSLMESFVIHHNMMLKYLDRLPELVSTNETGAARADEDIE